MSYNRRAKLTLDNFRGFTLRIVPKDVTRKPISRIYSTLYSTLASSKPKFPGFSSSSSSSSSSWYKPIPQLGRITRTAQNSPFLGCANRYYHGEVPNRSGRFRTRWHDWCAWVRTDNRRLWAARFLGSGVFIALCWSRFETIPYSKRTHFVIVRREWEKFLGDLTFVMMKIEGTIGRTLPDGDLQTRRVRGIGNEITQGLMRGITREDQEKGRRWWRGSRVATSHLDFLKWEFYVVDQPDIINAYCLFGGKILVYTGLFRYFISDEEIAAILCHEVGHAVARHYAEAITKYLWLLIPQLVFNFFQCFSGAVAAHAYTFDGLCDLLFTLPFARRRELEADYIGLLLLASAGYDPRVALDVCQKFKKLAGESPNQKDYLSTHPTGKKRAEKLAQSHVMEEALSIYREVEAGRGAGQ